MAKLFRMYSFILKEKPLLVTSVTSSVCYCIGDQLAQNIEIKLKKRDDISYRRTTIMTLFGLGIGGPLYYMWFKKIHYIDKYFEKLVKWNYERQLKSKLVNSFSKHIKDGKIDDMSMKSFREMHQKDFGALNNVVVFRSKTILAGQIYADQFVFSVIYPVIFMMTTGVIIDNTTEEDFKYIKENKSININKLKNTIISNYENMKNKYFTIYATDCAVWPLIQIANFAFIPEVYQPIFVNFVNIFWNAFISYTSQGH